MTQLLILLVLLPCLYFSLLTSLMAVGTMHRNRTIVELPIYRGIAYFGGQGVTLFFRLTGFLLGRLLVRELEKNKFVSIRFFYLERQHDKLVE